MRTKNLVFLIAFLFSILMMLVSCRKQSSEWKGTVVKDEEGYPFVKGIRSPGNTEEFKRREV